MTAWQEAKRVQDETMRRLLDPLDGIRKRLLVDNTAQKLIRELTAASSIQHHFKPFATGIGSVLARQVEESRKQHRPLLDSMAGSSIQNYLKEFETVNKQWRVPSEVLDIVGSFRAIQEQLGRVALPTIDWGAAGALAEVLGKEGIEEQLALLGIASDGTMHLPTEMPQKGILSRKQSDVLVLVSLLLTVLFFTYQEFSHWQDKAEAKALQAAQAQQIQHLTTLIERALPQVAQTPEVRFVVRKRPAKVRSKPEHGTSVEGKLLPNEVVRAIDRKGRWVEVEYYHWLHEEYRTGWVLKHYLERVPPSFSRNNK